MGRPAGAVEKVLFAEEIATLSASIVIPPEISEELQRNPAFAGSIFDKVATKLANEKKFPSRELLKRHAWILKPLCVASPAQIIRHQS